MALERDSIHARLRALRDDLTALESSKPCPWPLARIFNALLVETRELLPEDPILISVATLRVGDKASRISSADVGTVRGLCGQLVAAIENPGAIEKLASRSSAA